MSLSRPTMSAIRFGYGIRPGEELPDGPDALLAELDMAAKAPLRFPAEGIEGRYETIAEFARRYSAARSSDKEEQRSKVRPIRKDLFRVFGVDQHARVAQSVYSPYGFHERLAAFWFDHFSVSAKKQHNTYLMTPLYEAEALRPNMTGPFNVMLKAAVLHPAMLFYLDQIRSSGPNSRRRKQNKGLNENLGRELLELHTLGADGGYTQDDVRAAALVLTGVTVDRRTGRTSFRRQMAEPGPLKFMDKTYGAGRRSIGDAEAMLDDLAAMPQTGRHICHKLAVHFISDKPPEELVETMVKAWDSSDGNLRDVYAAMLKHPAAWENPGEKVRQPFDYVVAGLRAINVPESALAVPVKHAADDKEEDLAPPATPQPRMAGEQPKADGQAKADMAAGEMSEEEQMEAEDRKKPGKRPGGLRPPVNPISVRSLARLGQPVWMPASPAGTEEAFSAWVSSSQITGRIEWAQRVANRFGERIDPTALLKEVLRDAARDDTIKVVAQAPNRNAGVVLVLASPEFNRR